MLTVGSILLGCTKILFFAGAHFFFFSNTYHCPFPHITQMQLTLSGLLSNWFFPVHCLILFHTEIWNLSLTPTCPNQFGSLVTINFVKIVFEGLPLCNWFVLKWYLLTEWKYCYWQVFLMNKQKHVYESRQMVGRHIKENIITKVGDMAASALENKM